LAACCAETCCDVAGLMSAQAETDSMTTKNPKTDANLENLLILDILTFYSEPGS